MIYFFHRIRPPEPFLALNGGNIPFVNNVKYGGVMFDKKITWRLHTHTIEAKTRPLAKEDVSHGQDSNCKRGTKI
jgi:hypothetical protein